MVTFLWQYDSALFLIAPARHHLGKKGVEIAFVTCFSDLLRGLKRAFARCLLSVQGTALFHQDFKIRVARNKEFDSFGNEGEKCLCILY